jgi:hypothetical protein
LAAVRDREAARQAGATERTGQARADVEQLQRRLTAQRDYLTDVAARLGEPRPSFDGVAPTGLTDIAEAIRRGWDAVTQADGELRQAEQRGNQPTLLPGMSTTGRNAVVYAAATFLALLVSCGLYSVSPQAGVASVGLLAWSLCGLPAVAFFGGYLIIAVFGRPRLQTTTKASHSVRLGGLICFVGMWGGWIAFLITTSLL